MNSLADNSNSSVSTKSFQLSFLSKKKVDNFYRRQSNLLKKFENDSKQIQNFQNQKNLLNAFNNDVSSCLLQSTSTDKSFSVKNFNQPNINSLNKIKNYSDPQISIVKKKNVLSTISIGIKHLALLTLFINILLTIAKAFASYLSGSLSIISSLVDSLVDITSGLVIWLTNRAIRKHDPYLYPIGRTRLEPIALVIVSVIMAVASLQMILQSLDSVLKNKINPHVDFITFCIMIATIISKFLLFLACFRSSDSSMKVLALDHRNDCLSNFIALICAFLAQKVCIYLDPIGAIFVALYVAVTWFRTGKEQLMMLSGRSAKPEFINRIIKLCIDHDDRVNFIDTVYVYHIGIRFLVEVHIVLDKYMSLKDSHDISEALQNSIESLSDVERAFVHVDYEFDHKPQDEHKFP